MPDDGVGAMNNAGRLRPIAVFASLLLASLLSAQPDQPPKVSPSVATAAEACVGLATSAGFGVSEYVILYHQGPTQLALGLFALNPAATAATTWLVGRWLEPGGDGTNTAVGAYLGAAGGVVAAFGTWLLTTDDIDNLDVVLWTGVGVCVGTAAGAVLDYKLSRKARVDHNFDLRLDPPSLALSLKSPKPGASPEIAGVRLNLLSVRF